MIKTINKSLLAGILIGLGVIINTQMQVPIIGPMLFSFGLLVIINMQLNLYTGKIGFIAKFKEAPFLLTILLFNLIGIAVTVGLYTLANNSFVQLISAAAATKFLKSILTLFINAIFCGILIHFAVKNKIHIFTIFAIMIFILMGAEHCIADFPYLLFNLSLLNVAKFISIIIGNSIGSIIIERLCKE